MILADTSVWVDHLRRADANLTAALERGQVLAHPWVIGELALGGVAPPTLRLLERLPAAPVVSQRELMFIIEDATLSGRDIGWVDAALIASTRVAGGARLATRDKKLHAVALDLGIASST